jgi:thiol:disulfide interchange protein
MATRTLRVLTFLYSLTFLTAAGTSLLSAQNESAARAQGGSVAGAPAVTYAIGAFDPARDAEKDLREAVALAGKSGRRVLMDVGGEWCVWCRRLDTLWATNAGLRAYRDSNYVTLKVNWSPENKNVALLSKYPKIHGYPHFFVLEKDGAFLHSQDTGELEKGKGHDPEKVMAFLKTWAPPVRQSPK